jgi:hypothetical protein
METTYKNFRISLDEAFGDPYVSLVIEAHQNGKVATISFPYSYWCRFVQNNYPKEGAYIAKVRNSLIGYGSKEDEMIQTLLEEGFPVEDFLIACIESYDNLVAKEIEREELLMKNAPKNQGEETASQILEELESFFPSNPIRFGKFLDGIEKAILTYLIDNYPELTEAGKEDIEKLENIMLNHIPQLGNELIEHIYEVREKKDLEE